MKFIIVAIAAVILAACVYQPPKMTGATRVIYCANKDYNPATAHEDIKFCRLGLTKETL
ncbi:hypothetical protein [Serratia marcescens]|uniref:hypothetical protein n=1 Tax=Serratia marcescens TaxID=615 RepID=UPI001F1542B3|nr:hypothetical protein [Serratia marcescens]MDP8728350.1 hypothetical protein [Serratia marcescens]